MPAQRSRHLTITKWGKDWTWVDIACLAAGACNTERPEMRKYRQTTQIAAYQREYFAELELPASWSAERNIWSKYIRASQHFHDDNLSNQGFDIKKGDAATDAYVSKLKAKIRQRDREFPNEPQLHTDEAFNIAWTKHGEAMKELGRRPAPKSKGDKSLPKPKTANKNEAKANKSLTGRDGLLENVTKWETLWNRLDVVLLALGALTNDPNRRSPMEEVFAYQRRYFPEFNNVSNKFYGALWKQWTKGMRATEHFERGTHEGYKIATDRDATRDYITGLRERIQQRAKNYPTESVIHTQEAIDQARNQYLAQIKKEKLSKASGESKTPYKAPFKALDTFDQPVKIENMSWSRTDAILLTLGGGTANNARPAVRPMTHIIAFVREYLPELLYENLTLERQIEYWRQGLERTQHTNSSIAGYDIKYDQPLTMAYIKGLRARIQEHMRQNDAQVDMHSDAAIKRALDKQLAEVQIGMRRTSTDKEYEALAEEIEVEPVILTNTPYINDMPNARRWQVSDVSVEVMRDPIDFSNALDPTSFSLSAETESSSTILIELLGLEAEYSAFARLHVNDDVSYVVSQSFVFDEWRTIPPSFTHDNWTFRFNQIDHSEWSDVQLLFDDLLQKNWTMMMVERLRKTILLAQFIASAIHSTSISTQESDRVFFKLLTPEMNNKWSRGIYPRQWTKLTKSLKEPLRNAWLGGAASFWELRSCRVTTQLATDANVTTSVAGVAIYPSSEVYLDWSTSTHTARYDLRIELASIRNTDVVVWLDRILDLVLLNNKTLPEAFSAVALRHDESTTQGHDKSTTPLSSSNVQDRLYTTCNGCLWARLITHCVRDDQGLYFCLLLCSEKATLDMTVIYDKAMRRTETRKQISTDTRNEQYNVESRVHKQFYLERKTLDRLNAIANNRYLCPSYEVSSIYQDMKAKLSKDGEGHEWRSAYQWNEEKNEPIWLPDKFVGEKTAQGTFAGAMTASVEAIFQWTITHIQSDGRVLLGYHTPKVVLEAIGLNLIKSIYPPGFLWGLMRLLKCDSLVEREKIVRFLCRIYTNRLEWPREQAARIAREITLDDFNAVQESLITGDLMVNPRNTERAYKILRAGQTMVSPPDDQWHSINRIIGQALDKYGIDKQDFYHNGVPFPYSTSARALTPVWNKSILWTSFGGQYHQLNTMCNRHGQAVGNTKCLILTCCILRIQQMSRGQLGDDFLNLDLWPFLNCPMRALASHRVHGKDMHLGWTNLDPDNLDEYDDDLRGIDWETTTSNQGRWNFDESEYPLVIQSLKRIKETNEEYYRPNLENEDMVLPASGSIFMPSLIDPDGLKGTTRKWRTMKNTTENMAENTTANNAEENDDDEEEDDDYATELFVTSNITDYRHSFRNITGHLCYMNSVVQVLYDVIPLREEVIDRYPKCNGSERHQNIYTNLALSFKRISKASGTTTSGITKSTTSTSTLETLAYGCSSIKLKFSGRTDEDPEEFMIFLIDCIERVQFKLTNDRWPDLQATFESRIPCIAYREVYYLECLGCRQSRQLSSVSSYILYLRFLEDKANSVDLSELFANYFASVEVDINCAQCGHPRAKRHPVLARMPAYLIVSIVRHSSTTTAGVQRPGKIHTKVPCSDSLDLYQYLTSDAQNKAETDQTCHPKYDLISVIKHNGSVETGHIVAYSRNTEADPRHEWTLLDDDRVSYESPLDVQAEPYVQIWRQRTITEDEMVLDVRPVEGTTDEQMTVGLDKQTPMEKANDIISRLNQDNEHLVSEVSQMRSASKPLDTLNFQHEITKARLQVTIRQYEKSEDDNKWLQNDNNRLQQDNDRLRTDNNRLQQDNDRLRADNNRLRKDREGLKKAWREERSKTERVILDLENQLLEKDKTIESTELYHQDDLSGTAQDVRENIESEVRRKTDELVATKNQEFRDMEKRKNDEIYTLAEQVKGLRAELIRKIEPRRSTSVLPAEQVSPATSVEQVSGPSEQGSPPEERAPLAMPIEEEPIQKSKGHTRAESWASIATKASKVTAKTQSTTLKEDAPSGAKIRRKNPDKIGDEYVQGDRFRFKMPRTSDNNNSMLDPRAPPFNPRPASSMIAGLRDMQAARGRNIFGEEMVVEEEEEEEAVDEFGRRLRQ